MDFGEYIVEGIAGVHHPDDCPGVYKGGDWGQDSLRKRSKKFSLNSEIHSYFVLKWDKGQFFKEVWSNKEISATQLLPFVYKPEGGDAGWAGKRGLAGEAGVP